MTFREALVLLLFTNLVQFCGVALPLKIERDERTRNLAFAEKVRVEYGDALNEQTEKIEQLQAQLRACTTGETPL